MARKQAVELVTPENNNNGNNEISEKRERFKNVENAFDKDASPKRYGNKTAMDRVAEIHMARLKLGEKFLSEDITQKTEITRNQRVLLALLEILAENPLALSEKLSKEKYHIKKVKHFKVEPLRQFIDTFYILGIPVGRKGRKEEVEVLKSLFNDGSSGIPQYEPTVTEKLTK